MHLRVHPDYHEYKDATKSTFGGPSKGRLAYQQSEAHRQSYAAAAAESSVCLAGLAGAPCECFGPMTPHHVLAVSAAGSRKKAEQWPVIPLCAYHNDAIEGDAEMRRWARTTTFERGGREYPFRMTAADVRGMEPPVKERPKA